MKKKPYLLRLYREWTFWDIILTIRVKAFR